MGPGSGEEGQLEDFIGRLAPLIGESSELPRLKDLCRRYSSAILEAAFKRLQDTPRERIRTNAAALFTYLVKTLSRENHE